MLPLFCSPRCPFCFPKTIPKNYFNHYLPLGCRFPGSAAGIGRAPNPVVAPGNAESRLGMPPRTDKRIQMVSVRGERQLTSQLTSAKAPGGAERPDFLGNHHLPAVELTTRQSPIDSKCQELPGLVTIVRHPLSFPCSVLPVVPFVSQKRPENFSNHWKTGLLPMSYQIGQNPGA